MIQNGFDAHEPGSRGGRLAVHFYPDEDEHGVLYVANGGRPLSQSNFERMASLGESDKEIGVGIGNKGVGFKSVFQVCAVPEVFSADSPLDPGFNGYSFRFGAKADLVELLDNDAALANSVAEKLSLSLLTMPIDDVPDSVADLRSDGFVTVLRLPATTAVAAQEINERIERMIASASPVMLFLDRIESLSIKSAGSDDPMALRRKEEPGGPGTLVVLNNKDAYKVFEGTVPRERLLSALQEAVDEGALDEEWLAWDAEATVAVAVGDGRAVAEPHAFTFLPMGDSATSPLGGHINAPFITDFARVGLDVEQPVNRVLLECIADLCIKIADAIVEEDGDANTVIDLLGWRSPEVDLVERAANNLLRTRSTTGASATHHW